LATQFQVKSKKVKGKATFPSPIQNPKSKMALFIVFEGIDGSGTSTQASLLNDYFRKSGKKSILSPEPSDGSIGKFIRQNLKEKQFFRNDDRRFDEQMAYLFAADRYYHLYNEVDGVFKLIKDSVCVITTRYYFSSLAYNGNTQEESELIQRLNQDFPNPDLVIYLDIPVEVSLTRLKERSFKEIYETESKLAKVKSNYHNIWLNYKENLLIIDGTETIESIHLKIINKILNICQR
jgi:dTMP kinase